MGNIKSALPSPRIEDGVIKWYVGDEFEIGFQLNLQDADGEPIILNSTDTVTVSIKRWDKEPVKDFIFNNVENNFISLEFDSDTTALFSKGQYIYDIIIDGSFNVTVANDNLIEVE